MNTDTNIDNEIEMIENLLLKNRVNEIERKLKYRIIFEKYSQYLEILGTILSLIGILFNFMATYYNYHYYSFLSGIMNSISIVCLKCSTYFCKEQLQKKEELKSIILEMDIEESLV